jgi:hypothetical protein
MWSACRITFVGTFLYASYSSAMQSTESQTGLAMFDPAGWPSNPFSHTVTLPSGHVLSCMVLSTSMCDKMRCEEAGGRCLPSYKGHSCTQHVHFTTGEGFTQQWSLYAPTLSACQHCLCRKEGTVKRQKKEETAADALLSLSGQRSAIDECNLTSKFGMDCNIDRCKGANGRCILRLSGLCTFDFPEDNVTTCDGCQCRKHRSIYQLYASGQ